MKTKIMLLAVMLLAGITTVNAQNTKPIWKEQNTFHSFMSAAFHPAEEGNFMPLKERADSLLLAAKNWQASPIPADFKPAETKAALKKLVIKCTAVKKAVDEKVSNEILMKLITEAHDVFHTIVGECRKTEE